MLPQGKHKPSPSGTIYWNSSLATGKDGIVDFDFIMPDLAGDYEIYIEAVAKDSNSTGTIVHRFSVSDEPEK